MKSLSSQLIFFFHNKTTKKNASLLVKFIIFLVLIVTLYSVLFHVIMLYEGKNFSWITGFYWSLTVMSTLGFGDITFTTDIGLIFTIIVLLSGIVFLLIILPFTFIQFFYSPWLEAQAKNRTPRDLAADTRNHIIITNLDPITIKLIQKLEKYNYVYVIIANDLHRATEIYNEGYNVMVGELDDPDTYTRARIDQAALVVVTNDDITNTSIAFTIREITDDVPIVTKADRDNSIDILNFPGNINVFPFMKMLGEALAHRTPGVSDDTHVISKFEDLLIVEVPAMTTELEGQTIAQAKIRENTGVTVVGLWEKGRFTQPHPNTMISNSTVLVLAGSEKQQNKFEMHFSLACPFFPENDPVLILGGGRVGLAAAATLEQFGIPYNIVEKHPKLAKKNENTIHGDAADLATLVKAGIENARAIIITTHNDPVNIYLAFYCRQLRPDIQIITRATLERSVPKLHRGGADLVMSYAKMGANSILSVLRPDEIFMAPEGLNVFSTPVPPALKGKNLIESSIRERTGCSVIAVKADGTMIVGPDPSTPLNDNDELILIGTNEAEHRFSEVILS